MPNPYDTPPEQVDCDDAVRRYGGSPIPGRAVAVAVIDTAGMVRSAQVVETSNAELEARSLVLMAACHYRAARWRGRPVNAFVVQPFQFSQTGYTRVTGYRRQ
jgi:hypothetical protein